MAKKRKQNIKPNKTGQKQGQKPTKFKISKFSAVLYVLIAVITLMILNTFFGRPKSNRIKHVRYRTDFHLTAHSKIKKIDALQPNMICLGHSHLKHALVVHDFIKQTQVPILKEHLSGSQSSYWYLMFKNVVLKSSPRPPVVTIFFAETELTTPKSKVGGHYKQYIDMIANPRETILDRLAYFDEMDDIEHYLRNNSALFQKHYEIKAGFKNEFKRKIENILGLKRYYSDTAIAHVFANENMNDELFGQLQDKVMNANSAYDFDEQINKSFLPEIIRLANESNTKLIFVSIPREQDLFPEKFTKKKRAYNADLEQYFLENDITYFNIAKNAAEYFTEKAWYDKHHMVYQGESAKLFTEILANKMMPYLKDYQVDSTIVNRHLTLPETKNP